MDLRSDGMTQWKPGARRRGNNMTWILLISFMTAPFNYTYAGEYTSHKQCDEMAERIRKVAQLRTTPWICVEKPSDENTILVYTLPKVKK